MSQEVFLRHTDLDEDKGQLVLRNMKTNIIKLRAEKNAQGEFLNKRLSSLDSTRKKAEIRIIRGIKELKEQAQYLQGEKNRVNKAKQKNKKGDRLPDNVMLNLGLGRPISRRTPMSTSRRNTPQSILKPVRSSRHSFTRYCKFEEKKHECKSFPCAPCSNYSNIGYFWTDDADKMDVHSVPRGLSARSRSELWQRVETTSVLRPLRQPYNKCIKQEKSLQQIMNHMREKNDTTKPVDWNIRYGQPTPLRKILKPARMTEV